MKKKFTILNLLLLVAFLAGIFAWLGAFRFAKLPDGYIWDHNYLNVQYPETPETFNSESSIEFTVLGHQHSYSNGDELYRKYYYQGWWICRRNFFDEQDGFPFDPADWKYIDESLVNLADDDFRMHPQLAMRDGCRDCSLQIQELLRTNSTDELRTKLIKSKTGRFLLPVICTVAFAILVLWQWRTTPVRNQMPTSAG
jgi:hypothetical protein